MDILDYTGTKFINSPINLPTLAGNSGEKGKTGAVVKIYVGEKLFTVPVDPQTGLFTWTATEPFLDGDYSVSIVTVDRAGNVGTPILRTLRIDTTPPDAPELLNLYDDQGGKQSSFDPGQTTDDKRPKLTGIAQEGTLVYLRDADGNTIGSARADKVTGKWVMEPDQDLKDGDNDLTLVAEETFGSVTREGAPSASFKIVIGADSGGLPPNTITITQAIDDAGSATGVLSNGALTDDTTPTLNGVVSAGSTVTVYYRLAGSNIWAGSATATVTGENWTWTPGSALPSGTYEFQASIGSTSSALFLLDIAAGADDIQKKTRIESAQDDFGTWQGPLSNGAITDDTTPTLSGRGEANGKVVVRYGVPANTVVVDVDSSGHWTWTPAPALTAGNWNFDVQPQGHTKWSETFSLSITDASGFNPVITHAYDDVGTPGNLANGDTTDDTTPTLHGRAEANSTLTLRYRSGTGSYASVQVDADSAGNWTWTPPALQNGSWSFEVQKAGQSGWNGLSLTIDSSADRNPVIDYAADNAGSVRDNLSNGDTTDDTTPTLHGTAAANSAFTLRYRLDSGSWTSVSLTANSSGNWSWTPPTLQNGNWTFEVQKAGQSGWDSMGLTIDTTSDRNPVISYAADNVGSVREKLYQGDTTDDTTPTLHGTAAANSTFALRYRLDSGAWKNVSITANSSGNWSWTPPALNNGNWTFEVQKAGQSGWNAMSLIIDTNSDINPSIDYAQDNVGTSKGKLYQGDTTDDTTPTLHGTAAANGAISVSYRLGSGSWSTVQLTAGTDGKWSWTPPALQNGEWTFKVEKAGWSGWSSIVLNIDSAADRSTVIDYAADNVGSKQDDLQSGATTDDTTPTLHGTAANNGMVYLKAVNGADSQVFSFKANSAGKWQWTPPSNLAQGDWTFQVSKAAGSGFGDAFELKIDNSALWSGHFDFENTPPGFHIPEYQYSQYKYGDALLYWSGEDFGTPSLQTIKDGPESFGEKAIRFTNLHSALYIDFFDSFTSEQTIRNFSYELYNSGNEKITVLLYIQNKKYSEIGSIEITIPIASGEKRLITENDFPPEAISRGISTFGFNPGSDTIWLDNFSYEVEKLNSPTSFHIESDDVIHQLDGLEQLSESSIIGSEDKIDTLQLTGKDQLLDLTDLSSKIESIEIFDITGTGDNTLKLDLNALLQHGEKDLFIEDGKTQLVVNGNEGDVVQLVDILPEGSDISEWQHQEGTVTVAGVEYNVYSHNDAELLVQQGVKTELV